MPPAGTHSNTPLTRPVRSFVFLLVAVLLVSACAQVTRTDRPLLDSITHERARSLANAGNYTGAAELYLQSAVTASGSEQQGLYLYAAENFILAGDLDRAANSLDQAGRTQPSGRLLEHGKLLRAKIAIARLHPFDALRLLTPPPADGPYIKEYLHVRAEAFLQANQYLQSAAERVALARHLDNDDDRLRNEYATWSALNNLTDMELQELRTAPAPDTLSGWMELVELARLYMHQPDVLAQVTPHWQARYPGHPANRTFIGELLKVMSGAGQPPASIAVLLPLSGMLSSAAAAVRDGIMAAYYDSPDNVSLPVIRFYDTGHSAGSAVDAYRQAEQDGMLFALGPLRKEAVQALADLPERTLPALALNRAESAAVSDTPLYQFGLAPEDEAREAARFAWREGHERALALRPDTTWGDRVYAAFETEWQTLGGTILDQQAYESRATDHGDLLSAMLNLDSSKARHRKLAAILGEDLKFEPRRRQDVDMVFLLADPQQARLIRPQLSFYRASSVPVFTTSHVYTGEMNAERDIDLNGITFCDMPWILTQDSHWKHLKQAVSDNWPEHARRYARLYALGIDAYRVTPMLGQLGNNMFGAYSGVSGNLSLGPGNQVQRTLRCAVFRNGIPVLLEAASDPLDAVLYR